jgi:hypothetical protein
MKDIVILCRGHRSSIFYMINTLVLNAFAHDVVVVDHVTTKNAPKFDVTEDASKWNLYQLRHWSSKYCINYNQILNRIKDVVIKTCIAHEPQITGTYSRILKLPNTGKGHQQ